MLADTNDRFERQMLGFALRWHPYGGGSRRLIFEEFGLDAPTYFSRLARILDADRSVTSEKTRAAIRSVCAVRLRE
ncbi:DUF3263 domain-containing protein [Rhodococcus pseudokoreensis]|uniref:DUF3263 domain-containing protein n=1 Tax=Rhodococcus pseudokoreensis TaxID=2811421 RepID=A0A974W157_9NOCA|nr:DUF3263 domain-containing protein [Rhodococcus pseudokoreensis]QSE89355.1 DUF3263 domain-containing protein [Rhodococcus pseudokoreensis]